MQSSRSMPSRRVWPRFADGLWAEPLCVALLIAASLWHLAASAAWWDEGWTLSVAQNWVRYGHYGRLIDGQLGPSGLEAAFPTTGLVALSFRIFGIGLWQGRLVGVVALLASLALLWSLGRRLYSRTVAWATVGTLLLLSAHPQLHPLIIGRQVLAEMPMLMYLLAGYLACHAALRGRSWLILLAVVGWGIAIITKSQALPFWLVSLLLPLLLALIGRQWRIAGLLLLGMTGALGVSRGLLWLIARLLRDQTVPPAPLEGLYEVVALVLDWPTRMFAIQTTLTFALPTVLGLGFAVLRLYRSLVAESCLLHRPRIDADDAVQLALLNFAGSWLAWYALLSIGSPRYLFPATFVGGLFVAALLAELTQQFALGSTLHLATGTLRPGGINRRGLGALAALVLIAAMLPLGAMALARSYGVRVDTDARDVVAFLHETTPSDALIETYDSELHVWLERRFHYPPDQTHIDLIRRSMAGSSAPVSYDPLVADPDYLVVGEFNRRWQLYDQVLASNAFRLTRQFGQYQVYQRVR